MSILKNLPKPLTQAQVARRYGVTISAICQQVKAGMPLTNWEAVEEWRANTTQPKSNSPSLAEARLAKLKAETERIELKLQIDKGEMIRKSDVADGATAAMAAMSAELMAMMNDLPGQLVGLAEIGIRDKLGARIDLLLANFKGRMEKLEYSKME